MKESTVLTWLSFFDSKRKGNMVQKAQLLQSYKRLLSLLLQLDCMILRKGMARSQGIRNVLMGEGETERKGKGKKRMERDSQQINQELSNGRVEDSLAFFKSSPPDIYYVDTAGLHLKGLCKKEDVGRKIRNLEKWKRILSPCQRGQWCSSVPTEGTDKSPAD